MLRVPDILFLSITLAVFAGLLIWLGQPVWEGQGWRSFLFLGIPLIYTLAVTSWWVPRQQLRLWGYKKYYRFFGPSCNVRILGRFQVDANRSDDALLETVYSLAKQLNSAAKVDLSIDNRSVIRVGAQVLTTTVVTVHPQEGQCLEEESEVQKSISIDLGGYEGAIGSMDVALRRRALPLLVRLNSEIKKQGTPANLSLIAQIDGTNPFLTFYLRDVPASRVESFYLKLETDRGGHIEMLEMTADRISVGG